MNVFIILSNYIHFSVFLCREKTNLFTHLTETRRHVLDESQQYNCFSKKRLNIIIIYNNSNYIKKTINTLMYSFVTFPSQS